MVEQQVDLCVEDWTDADFRHLVGTAWDAVSASPEDLDSIGAALKLQLLLRSGGYRGAMVEVHQSVDEALGGVAHFDISREPSRGRGLELGT